MKLAVDVMGFENDLNEAIKACRDFSKKNKVEIILVGNQDLIYPLLKSKDNFSIVDVKEFITQDDSIFSLRNKKETSMHKAIDLVLENKADGVLSAGNSSIYVFLTYQKFGLINGINKPGFMVYIPTFKNKNGFNILDVGASKEVDEYDLYMFSLMANIYTPCRGVTQPKIGVLNIGTESHKGFERHTKVDNLLKQNKKMNYIGFVEPKNLLEGICDVVVTDGYSGNICLKSLEGTSKSIFSHILKYYKNPLRCILFPFVAPMLLKMKKKFDYKNNAGAFVLGLNHIAVKTHGSADYKQFYSSLRMLKESIEYKILDKIKKEVENESKRMKK